MKDMAIIANITEFANIKDLVEIVEDRGHRLYSRKVGLINTVISDDDICGDLSMNSSGILHA